MPFPCNGHLLCCVNIPAVLLMFFNKFASCSIPYFNLFFIITVCYSIVTVEHNVIVTFCSVSLAIRQSPDTTGYLSQHRKHPRFKG